MEFYFYVFIILITCQIVQLIRPDVWFQLNTITDNTTGTKTTPVQTAQVLPGTTESQNGSHVAAYFNGTNSGIIWDNAEQACFTELSTCTNGFTITFWIKWIRWQANYIFSSTFLNMKHFLKYTVPIEVWNGNYSCRVFHQRDTTVPEFQWLFYTIVWNTTCLSVWVNGEQKEAECKVNEAPRGILYPENVQPRRLALGTSAGLRKQAAVEMFLDELKIWNTVLQQADIINEFKTGLSLSYRPLKVISPKACVSDGTLKDWILEGYNYRTETTTSLEDCFIKCSRHAECLSFNYQYTETSICQLNTVRKDHAPLRAFKRKESFIYFEMN